MCARNQAPLRALSLPGGGAARSLAKCARRAALVGLGFCPMEAHSASKTALSLGARSRSNVPAAASNKLLSCACAQDKAPPRALSLSREGAARAHAAYARVAPLWLGWDFALRRPTAPARRPSPSVHGRNPMCQPRPPTSSFLAHVRKKKRHRARSLSREEAQHARLRRARAVPRWFESVPALWEPTVPTRRPSSSVHGCAPTCQPRPQTSRFLAYVRKKPSATARALSAGKRRSTLAGEVRAPRRAGWTRFLPYGSPQCQRDSPLSRCTVAIQCASRGLQQAAFLRMWAR